MPDDRLISRQPACPIRGVKAEPENAPGPRGIPVPIPKRGRGFWPPFCLALALLGLAAAVIFYERLPLSDLIRHSQQVLGKKAALRAWLQTSGAWSQVGLIVVQALQVLFSPIGGEAAIGLVAGFLFGVIPGVFYAYASLVLGSVLAYLVGRGLEAQVLMRFIRPETMARFNFLLRPQGVLLALICFILPVFPKDCLCYLLGLSRMPWRIVLVVISVGRLPGAVLFTLQGAQIYRSDYYGFLIIAGSLVILGVGVACCRDKVSHWARQGGIS
jgi:uncharacterized membrane protein YdjX (TVP38/TMEM64 family)